ncbi:response regulator [Solirubrobacter phytolaccae]|uniref:Response regulator n=1 Tax=Solirubrobacter phytolaccae TaxID=1404360 RepID=A0A9X3N688_9ACTN|nr:response regulator [Solirubrobacter phytolaccae]MDA0180458.1 response regulator [Solirubrobacter phytolaccae]
MSAGRLLLVDDEPDIRMIATMALERVGGWTVTAAASAGEAIAAVRADLPDVVLLDVMMPDTDGPATLAQLRPLLGDGVPVIFLTARGETDHLLALGAAGVIAKPFDPIALPGAVAAITAR